MTFSWEHRSPIAPGKPRVKRWDITRALYRCAGRSIARALSSDHLRAGHQQTIDSFANAIPFVELARALGEQSEAGI